MENSSTQDSPKSTEENEPVVVLSKGDKIYRLIKTIFLFQVFITNGVAAGIIGPTLIDLSELTGCNYEELSRTVSAKFGGIIIGSFVAGALTDRFSRWRDLIIVVHLVLMAAGLTLVPWLHGIWELGAAFLMQGIAHGGLSAASNVLICQLWGSAAPAPMQIIHMGFSVGTTIAPLVAGPFLSPTNHTNNSSSISTIEEHFLENNSTNHSFLFIPYGITGGWAFYAAMPFLIFTCFPRAIFISQENNERKSICEVLSPRSCTGRQTSHGVIILIFIFFIYLTLVGKDLAICLFFFTIAVEGKLQFSKTQAANWNTVFWVCYSLGRLVVSGVAKYISPPVLFFGETILVLVTLIGITFVGLKSVVYFWTLSLLFAFFIGPQFPSGITWISHYIELTGMTLAVLDCGTGVAGLIFPWLSGYLYQYYNAQDLIYLSLGSCVCMLLTLTLAQIFVHMSKRQTNEETVNGEDSNTEIDERTPLIN